jgi:hypothetical protein
MSNSDNSCILYEVKNDNVDIDYDELSKNLCIICKVDMGSNNPRQLCRKTYCENEEDHEDNKFAEICPYDDKDIKQAKDLGMTVEDMFKMFEEINNYESDEPDYSPEYPEWPFDRNSGYCDEGFEESYYG